MIPATKCNHNVLKLLIAGTTPFYKCDVCRKNFKVPEPLQIKVTYPEPCGKDERCQP